MCWPTFITRIDHGGLRLPARPSPSSKSPVPCLLSCFYCGDERCADDGLLLQPDSRIARSSSSGLVALKTGACGGAALAALLPDASVRRAGGDGGRVPLCTPAGAPFAATGGDTMPARTGAASLIGASVREDGEAVLPGTWIAAAGSGSGCAGMRAAAVAGALRTGTVTGATSGPSGMGTNADTGGRGGAACCSVGGGGYAGDVSGACDPVPMRAGSGTTGVAATGRMVVTTMGAAGAAGAGVRIGVGTPIAATARARSAAATVTAGRCVDAGAGVAATRGPGTTMDAGAAGAAATVCALLWGARRAAAVAGAVLLLSQLEREIACPTSVCASTLLASSVSTSRAF
jgi:hypothetical protein